MKFSFKKITTRSLAILLFAFALLEPDAACNAAQSAQTSVRSQEVEDIRPLELGKSIVRELAGAQAHDYRLLLATGQYLSVEVEQIGIDVVVTLFEPSGKHVTLFERWGRHVIEINRLNSNHGLELLSTVIKTPGAYRLEVRSPERDVPTGQYEIKIKELRAATPQDESQVAAKKASANNDELSDYLARRQRALEKYEEHLRLSRAAGDRKLEATTLLRIGAGREHSGKAIAVFADPVFDREDPRVRLREEPKQPTLRSSSKMTDLERAMRDVALLDSRGNLSRLPFSREEAEAILAAAPKGQAFKAIDFKASKAMLESPEISQHGILHFATHALLNSKHPELSGIVLSLVDEQGRAQDGFLRLHDIYNLNLPAELVVLSACQTALGKEVKGEGLLGLTRGFMYSGARQVMASLWKVDDGATAEFMREFYQGIFRRGLKPAAALRAAQVEMRKKSQWRSPYFWAAFVLQGEYR